jgi:hypothetical protein
MAKRCPWAIKYGVTLVTRCMRENGHEGSHVGRGLVQFPYQTVEWFEGDRRQFISERPDEYSWQEGGSPSW